MLTRAFQRVILQFAGLVTLISLALTLVSAYYSVKLYMNLKPDIEELLPLRSRSVQNANEVRSRLESTDSLAILIFPKDGPTGRSFSTELATELKKAPKETITRVEYRIQDTLDFFRKRGPLFIELEDLRKIRDFIRDRIEYETQLHNPLNIFSNKELPEPKLDFKQLELKYSAKNNSFAGLPDGFFATQEEDVFAVLAYLPSGGSRIEKMQRLHQIVDETTKRLLQTPSFKDKIDIKFTGEAQELIEEQASLIEDLGISTALVTLIVTLMIWFYYGSFRVTLALITSLIVGSLWCFGLSYFAVGYLNANSAFMGAIIFGNGINFGIIFLARYVEELEKGSGSPKAIFRGVQTTGKATLTAALAAGFAYGSLALTEFRGFRQFGIIGLIGMVFCWMTAFTVLPAILTLIDRIRPVLRRSWKRHQSALGHFLSVFVPRYSRSIVACSVLITLGTLGLTVAHIAAKKDVLETQLSKLRDKRSEVSGAGYYSQYLRKIFRGYPNPTVILASSHEEARKVDLALRERMKLGRPQTLIASVQSLDDMIPSKQEEKISLLQDIRNYLPPRMIARMPEAQQKRIKEFLSPEAMQVITPQDLPDFVKLRIAEKTGALGNLVLVEPPTTGEMDTSEGMIRFVEEVREIADSVRPGMPVAGQVAVTADLLGAIRRDGPIATLASLIAVIILVLVLFRSLPLSLPVVGSLVLGVFWLIGLIFLFDLKINFLNFIALPITFGIGVDYSVNVFQRYLLQRDGDVRGVLSQTAGAVALASATTIVGFASLLLAGNRAFVSLGALAVFGEITCLATAVLVLPALLVTYAKRKPRLGNRVQAG